MVKKRYVDVKDVSVYTSLSEKTLYEWAVMGKIPSHKVGSRVLFDLQDMDKVMASLKRPYLQQEKTVNKIVGVLNTLDYNSIDSDIQTKSGFGKGERDE